MEAYNQFICGNDGDALEIRNDATSGIYQPAQWLVDWATGGKNDAGVAVNGYTALTHCPLWQGVNIIAGDFGQTPVRLLRNEFDEQRKHPSWNLLRVAPNELQSPSVWKETMMQWALIWGNGVSWIRRQGSRPVELIPLRPDCLWHQVLSFEGQKILLYHYRSPYPNSMEQYTFFPDEVLHFQGLTSDGVWGYPLWQIARNTIGHGLALEKHGNKQFSNGARPAGVLKHPGKMSKEARDNLRTEWNAIHAGADNAGKIAILWEAMEFQAMSNSNVESDWIEAKRMGVYEAASLLNLPPHKLGALQDSSVRANLEEQNADYVNRTLNRWYTRADEEYKRKLLTDQEWKSDEFCYKHDVDAFMKGDMDTLTTVADRCVKATLMNPNEGRKLIGLPPYEGGEKYGSPAINPNSNNENSPSSAGKTPKTPPNGPNAGETKSKLANAIDNEAAMLRAAAKSKKNFIGWLDAFYGRPGHRGSVTDIFDKWLPENSLPKPKMRRLAGRLNSWAYARRESLLDLSSVTKADGLAAAVEVFALDSAADIADELLDGIFEE